MKRYRVANPGRMRRISNARGRSTYTVSKSASGINRKARRAKKAEFGSAKAKYYKTSSIARGNRTSNPAKRKLTLKQKLHFGTARQRAAAKAALSGKRRTSNPSRTKSAQAKRKSNSMWKRSGLPSRKITDKAKFNYKFNSSNARGRVAKTTRVGNPAQIITLTNPGTTRKRTITTMAKKRVYRRKRTATATRRRRRNPGLNLMQAGRPRRRRMSASRRANTGTRRRSYRRTRNAGVLSGGFGSEFGIIGGGVLTSLISSKLPAGLNTGVLGYVSTAAVAIAQGTIAGKVFKNQALGKSMTIGGFVYLALRLVQDFVPSLSLPFRLGAIASSSFYTPQVPMGNSMTSFMTPPGVQAAIAGAMPMAGSGGMGRVGRVGRVR